MNAKEAQSIIFDHQFHTISLDTGNCFNSVCRQAAGYLAALEGPEVKALIKAFERYGKTHQGYLGSPCNIRASFTNHACECGLDKALAKFRDTKGENNVK